jgi:ubiquinone/menaquinone biosynthesis C-methylase UbiE
MHFTQNELDTIAYYDSQAAVWAEKRKKSSEPSFWDAEFNEFKTLKNPSGKVLEIGSGAGREALELVQMGYTYYGIDTSQELLKIARKANAESHFFHASPYQLPFENDSFDAFFSWALLPHVPKHRITQTLQELFRVLKPDGVGFIAMRQGGGERQEAETGRWFSYYSTEEFAAILNDCCFSILKTGIKPSRPNLTWLTFFVSPISHPAEDRE